MNWEKKRIGDLCDIKHGYAFKGEYFSNDGEYILLSPGNFHPSGGLKLKGDKEKYYSGDIPVDYILDPEDLLVVMTDLIQNAPILGGAALIPSEGLFLHNQRLGKVIDINYEAIVLKFLYYIFNSETYRGQVRASATGSTVRHTAPERIRNCIITLPPLPTQQRIASILSAYDDLIENNLKRIKLLEEAAQNIYREWFVNFRFPGFETATWYVDDKDRRLPEGWDYLNLDQVCDLTMGQSPSSDYYNEHGDGLPFHQGVTDFGVRFVTNTTYCSNPTRIAQAGDILCSVRAPVGRLNITLDQIIIGRGLSAMRNKNGNQSFQYYQLKSHFHTEDMIGGGSIFNSVTKKVLSEQELLLPSEGVVIHFESVIVPIDNQIQRLHNQNIFLKEARDILLPRLMNQTIQV